MRIRFIRLLAVCFLILGLWNLFRFLQGLISKNFAELGFLVAGIVLFGTGDNLFSLKEAGRKLALFVLGIDILRCIVFSLLALSQEDFGFSWTGLGASFESESKFLFAAGIITWISVDVLLGLLFIQEKTRLIFQSKQEELGGREGCSNTV